MSHAPDTVHGGLDPSELAELGIDPAGVLDFSANINPLGPPPAVRQALESVDMAAYPDRRCGALTDALARGIGVGPERVLVGNGSTELIHLLARAYGGRGARAVVFAPAFGEYAAAIGIAGGGVAQVEAYEADGFCWEVHRGLEAIARGQPALVFIGVPNNPTGVSMGQADVQKLAEATRGVGLLVLDEAYRAFAESPLDSRPLLAMDQVVLLRSMTKDYALPGLRLGYMVAAGDVVERTRRLQPPWSVNGMAQAAGLAALQDEGHLAKAREEVRRGKTYLMFELEALGLTPLPSDANFVTVKVGDGSKVRTRLLAKGMAVRDCASFGMPAYVRIAVRRESDCRRLIAALAQVVSRG